MILQYFKLFLNLPSDEVFKMLNYGKLRLVYVYFLYQDIGAIEGTVNPKDFKEKLEQTKVYKA